MLVPGLGYWISKAAQLHPKRIALITEQERLSYQALAERAERARHLLQRLDVKPGDRLGLLMYNDPAFLEILFAAAQVGAIVVPLNWRLSQVELAYQVQDADLSLLFVGPEQEEAGSKLGCRVINSQEYQALATDESFKTSDRFPEMEGFPGGETPLLLVYTSGTTGKPKGALLSHENLFWNALNDILALGLSQRDITATFLPLMHVGGLGLFTLPTLLSGGTVVMPRRFEAALALHLIARERVTLFLGVPTVHKMLVEIPEFEKTDLSSLRLVYNGGDRCPLSIVEAYRRRGIPFGGGYGLTETAPTAFMSEPDQFEAATSAEGFIGKPSFFTDARIVDEAGKEQPAGSIGELWLRGPNVFQGYWKMPVETEMAFKDGWFRTGDLAYRDKEGFTFIVGRQKDMIKSGGENVYPVEVEQALLEHPEVAEACVIAQPHPKWNEVPFAVVALKPGAQATEEVLLTFCRERLARYKVPVGVAFVESIPRTSIGKPDKPLLRRLYGGGR